MSEKQDTNTDPTKENLKTIIKKDSGLSFLKIAATALTAISMSLVTARLTGIVSSIILVALVSVGTALFNEFYRVVFSVTSVGAKKAIKPILVKTNAGIMNTETGEIVALNEEDLTKFEEELDEDNKEKSISEDNRSESFDEQKISTTDSGREQNTIEEKRPLRKRINQYFTSNPIMRFVVIFVGVALITICITNFTTDGKPENTFKTVYSKTTDEKKLSASEKQEIIDAAVAEAEKHDDANTKTIVKDENSNSSDDSSSDNKDTNTDSNSSGDNSTSNKAKTSANNPRVNITPDEERSTSPSSNSQDTTNNDSSSNDTGTDTQNSSDIATLEQRLNDLEKENKDLKDEIDAMKKKNAQSNTNSSNNSSSSSNNSQSASDKKNAQDIKDLQSQIKDLQDELDKVQNSNSKNTSTTTKKETNASAQQDSVQ